MGLSGRILVSVISYYSLDDHHVNDDYDQWFIDHDQKHNSMTMTKFTVMTEKKTNTKKLISDSVKSMLTGLL